MERILVAIRQECSCKSNGSSGGHSSLSEDMVKYLNVILDSIQKEALFQLNDQITSGFNEKIYDQKHLQLLLQLFKICVESDHSKLNLLCFDLLKIYIRQISECDDDSIKESVVTQILKQLHNIYNKTACTISLELCALIVEIAATFGPILTIHHVVDIIELCHRQIKEYILKDVDQAVNNRANFLKNFHMFLNISNISSYDGGGCGGGGGGDKISNREKILSAIYLTAGQVCHYFVKNKINHINAVKNPSTSADDGSVTGSGSGIITKIHSQEFLNLLLYLIKKLETKVSFFCEIDWNHQPPKGSNEHETKAEIFIMIKTLNCFYLKCIHFVLLTIPDAWKQMTNRLMEVVWKHLAPVLVSILNPLTSIAPTKNKSALIKTNVDFLRIKTATFTTSSGEKISNIFGRGSEKLHLSSPGKTNDQSINSLNHQERQYIYKIALELLRLFGLENSMRPLLEAIFYRIFLLPPLSQRLDSLIYMQDILRAPNLVLILISDPVCLFGPSVSNSHCLDLFQIFIDAIKEASLCDGLVLNQCSLACLTTLLNTLRSIASIEQQQNQEDSSKRSTTVNQFSPIFKLVSNYVEKNRKQFEASMLGDVRSNKNSRRLSKYNNHINPIHDRLEFSIMKNRIYGYDLAMFESRPSSHPVTTVVDTMETHAENNGSPKQLPQSQPEPDGAHYDFDYKNKLKTLISNGSTTTASSTTSSPEDLNDANQPNQAGYVGKKPKLRMRTCVSYKNTSLNSRFKCESFHISFEDIFAQISMIDLDVRLTNSDSKINSHALPLSSSSSSSSFDEDHDDQDRMMRADDDILNDVFVAEDPDDSVVFNGGKSAETLTDVGLGDDDDNAEVSIDNDNGNYNYSYVNENIHKTKMMADYCKKTKTNYPANLCFFERLLSRIFVRKLNEILPDMVACRNLFSVDESIQLFASKFCKDLYFNLNLLMKSKNNPELESKLVDLQADEIENLKKYIDLFNNLYINADGIYLTTYLTMLLNLKLLYSNYYQENSRNNIPITEKNFIDEIFNYHITIYLSPNFLAEIYQNVLSKNLFESIDCGDGQANLYKLPLVKFLLDVDILDRNNPEAFKLSDYVRLEQVVNMRNKHHSVQNETTYNHSKPLCLVIKRICSLFWEPMFDCIKQALSKKFTFQNLVQTLDLNHQAFISSICQVFNQPNKHQLAQSKNIDLTIQTILVLYDVCDKIHYYNRINSIYDLLYKYITKFWNLDSNEPKTISNSFNIRKSFSSSDIAIAPFHSAHSTLSCMQILAIKTLLTGPTRIGIYCPHIWKNVLDLCKFVIDVENSIFRSSRSSLLSRARVSINTILKSQSVSFAATDFDSNLHADHYQNLYDHNAFNNFPGINEVENSNIEQQFDLIFNEIKTKKTELEQDTKDLEQIIEYLSLLVGQIFENIPLKCNLSLLNSFINELCEYSRLQLKELNEKTSSQQTCNNQNLKSLMLFRLVEVILRFVRNGRPLLHFMKIWPTVSTHLVQASTHNEVNISKKAITSLHDIINAFLSSYSELDFFNFNESLFKPYEKLLRFEMCNSESQQELVLYSICEFVEGAAKEIRSGWRSIFKALKGSRLTIVEIDNGDQTKLNCTHHVQILIDTFEAFLRTDNMHVLAYASIDFIPCIFHLIKNFSTKPTTDLSASSGCQYEMFIVFLKCLQKFSKILRSINELSEDSFVNFHIRIKRIRFVDGEKLKESIKKIDHDCMQQFEMLWRTDRSDYRFEFHVSTMSLLQIWYMFLDEYALAICSSNIEFRPMLLEVYFTLVQIIVDIDGALSFSIYCFNHIDLPMVQCLLRETLIQGDDTTMDVNYSFLKTWLTIFNNHIIKYMLMMVANNDNAEGSDPIANSSAVQIESNLNLLLKQTLLIYFECLNGEYPDNIAILSLALIKHLLLSLNQIFSSNLWKIIFDYFLVAHKLTFHPLKTLMDSFLNLPIDLNSDLKQIKILTIRNPKDENVSSSCKHNQKRARQLLFIKNKNPSTDFDHQSKDAGGCYSHTIIVDTATGLQKSIPFCLFISQTHNHLILLRIMSSMLTFNLRPDLDDFLPFSNVTDLDQISAQQKPSNQILLLSLQSTQYNDLLFHLNQSFRYAMKFDSRPGLKYLLQHICHSRIIPNLYQISTLIWSTKFVVQFFLCSHVQYRNEENLSALEELFAEITSLYSEKMDTFKKNQWKKSKSICSDSSLRMGTTIHEDAADSELYQLISADSIHKHLEEYRKIKHMQFPVAETTNVVAETKQTNKHSDGSHGGGQMELLGNDTETFLWLWNDIISKCIRLHIDCDIQSFSFMLVQYQKLIRAMIMNIGMIQDDYDHHHRDQIPTREAILCWIEKLSSHFLLISAKNQSP